MTYFELAMQYTVPATVLTGWRCPGTPNTARTPRKSCTTCMLLPLPSAHNAVLNEQRVIWRSILKNLSIFSQRHRFLQGFACPVLSDID